MLIDQVIIVYLILIVGPVTVGAMTRAWTAVAVTVVLWAAAFAAIRAALEDFAGRAVGATAGGRLRRARARGGGRRPRPPGVRDLRACPRRADRHDRLPVAAQRRRADHRRRHREPARIDRTGLRRRDGGRRARRAAAVGGRASRSGSPAPRSSPSARAAGSACAADALLVLAAAVSQAAFFVLQKPLLPRYGSLRVTAWAMWLGALALVPFAPAAPAAVLHAASRRPSPSRSSASPRSALAFLLWAYALSRLEVHRAAAPSTPCRWWRSPSPACGSARSPPPSRCSAAPSRSRASRSRTGAAPLDGVRERAVPAATGELAPDIGDRADVAAA